MGKQTAIGAAFWSLLERLSTQVVGFLIGIVLARLLSPRDYGIVGMMALFIALSNVFIESGFANALIRKQDRTESDLSTAFYFNVVIGVCVYIILWVGSPFIAHYFDEPILVILVKIAGLNVLLNSLMIVQTAILTANLNIRLQTIINLSGQIPAGLIAVSLAYKGAGVYALVVQTVSASFIRCVLLWYYAKWRPNGKFNFNSFKYLWSFGSKLLGATLIGVSFEQVFTVLIGKYIGTNTLGYYSKGAQLRDNVTGTTNGIIQKIALPVLSRYQNDKEILTEKFREVMNLLVMLIAPLTAYLCYAAHDIIILLWTEKWIDSVVLFKMLIIGSMFAPIGYTSLALMQVVGKTGLILKLEFPKKAIYFVLIAIGFNYGVKGLCLAHVGISLTAAIVNMWPTRNILNYSITSQFIDLGKYMLIAFISFSLSSLFTLNSCHVLNIIGIFILGSTIYIGTLLLCRDCLTLKYVNMAKNYFMYRVLKRL